jgi:hypothetical protein
MPLIKALVLSAILTFVVSAAIHGGRSTGGYLNVQEAQISGHAFYWSFPLFIVAGAVIFGILLLMR